MSITAFDFTGNLTVSSTALWDKQQRKYITGLCEGNPSVIVGSPYKGASNVENISVP